MAISYRIDPQLGLVHTTATGVLKDEELLAHKRRLAEDPEFKPEMKELSDVRAVERLEVTTEGVRRLVATDQEQAPQLSDYKLALVVSTDIVFGMARMYQTLTEESVENVRVFRELDEARAWLGLPPKD
jgi:hypothetical protein